MQDINIPEVVAEVSAAHERYEAALATNDVAVLNELFWDSPHTIRFGPTGNQYGHAAIAEERLRGRPSNRTALKLTVTTYGRNFATTNLEARTPATPHMRQSQTWVRMPEGWQVVAAHVSVLPQT